MNSNVFSLPNVSYAHLHRPDALYGRDAIVGDENPPITRFPPFSLTYSSIPPNTFLSGDDIAAER